MDKEIEIDLLVLKIKNGEEAAFKTIYNLYFSRIYYFVYEFIPHKDIAENIGQDTFYTLWEKRKTLNNDTNISSFLFTVAKNNCLYRLRELRYRRKLFDSNVLDEEELELNLDVLKEIDTSTFIFNEIEEIIKQTLEGLPPQCKKVFELSRIELKKNKEIAEELDISIKTVENQMTKALKLFKTALKDYMPFVAYLFIS